MTRLHSIARRSAGATTLAASLTAAGGSAHAAEMLTEGQGALVLGSWGLLCMLAVACAALFLRLRRVREEGRVYRQMIESANSVILRMDMDGTIEYANRHALDLFGYDWNELVGRKVSTITAPLRKSDGLNGDDLWNVFVADPDTFSSLENDNVRKDGTHLRVAWTNRVLRSPSGRSRGVLSIGNNVTDIRRQQSVMARLETALDQALDGVVVTNLEGEIEYANPAWARQHGYSSPAQAKGMVLPIFSDSATLGEDLARMARKVRSEGAFAGEVRCPVQGGGMLDCWVSASQVRDEEGNPSNYVAIFRDISRQKLLEAEVRESEERFSELVNTIDEAFWLRSSEHLLYLSPGYERVFGCSVDEHVHDPMALFQCVHPDDRETIETRLGGAKFREQGLLDVELRMQNPESEDAEPRWIRARSYPVKRDGKLYRIAGVAEDITRYKDIEAELMRAKDDAEAAMRIKGMILNNITHEIRTPLNGVLGMLQILQLSPLKEEQLEYVTTAMESAQDLGSIIDTIIRYSEIDSEKVVVQNQPYSLMNILQGIMEAYRTKARERGLILRADAAPETDDALLGDGMRLKQVLEILVGNAIKFTNEGEICVQVSTTRSEKPGYVLLEARVSDTGVGIPQDRLARVLDGFVQADQSYSRRFGGLGLGLGMARRMVEIMHGEIKVLSEEGRGTTVVLRFETQSMEESLGEPLERAPETARGKPPFVLLCEGADTEALALKLYLQRRGVEVVSSGGVEQTMALLGENDFDLLILRDRIGSGRPSEVMEHVCTEEGSTTIPVLLIGRGEEAEKCVELGARNQLAPPVNLRRFWEIFKEMVTPAQGVDTIAGND